MLRRAATTISRRSAVTLPPLKYEYQDLEPFINAEIMELHHSKHHQTYTNNFNNLSAQIQEAVNSGDFTTQQKLQAGMKFNYGGYVNHCLFFDNLCPNAEKQPDPTGTFQAQIDKDFGSFENFKNELSAKSIGIMGSGWGWLGWNEKEGRLQTATVMNQDMLEVETGLKPLLGIDCWEHAYYLQYKNVRPDYVNQIWNVMNWEEIENRFKNCKN